MKKKLFALLLVVSMLLVSVLCFSEETSYTCDSCDYYGICEQITVGTRIVGGQLQEHYVIKCPKCDNVITEGWHEPVTTEADPRGTSRPGAILPETAGPEPREARRPGTAETTEAEPRGIRRRPGMILPETAGPEPREVSRPGMAETTEAVPRGIPRRPGILPGKAGRNPR